MTLTAILAWSLDEGGYDDYITITGKVTEGLPQPSVPDLSMPDLFEVSLKCFLFYLDDPS